MTQDPDKLIWNAHVQELMVEGAATVDAFEALRRALSEANRPSLVMQLIGGEQPKRPETIEINRQDVELLVGAYDLYCQHYSKKTMGICFGLEGHGRGTRKALENMRVKSRNTSVAVSVSLLIESGVKKSQAIRETAENFGMTEDAARKALDGPDRQKLAEHITKLRKEKRI